MSAPAELGAKLGSEFELRVDALAAGGEGVGRHAGLVVFVPRSAPGDRLRVRVTRAQRRWVRAEIVSILESGPHRREARCAHYARCGGCDWMHMDEEEQTRARIEIVCEALRRIGGLSELPAIEQVASPRAFGYRSRARVAVAGGRVGFRERGAREVVDVDLCPILDAGAQARLTELRSDPPASRGEVEIDSYGGELRVGSRVYRIGPGAFFQPNGALWERWYQIVVEACGTGQLAVELYAGVGFYTVGLERSFERVIAVERGNAARWAERNTHGSVIRAAVEDWAPRELGRIAPELVLLNPPRTGCHKSVLDAVRESGASRAVYVACDPATLARDLRRCIGDMELVRLVVMDSLPQTHHVEVVAVLERVDNRRTGHLHSHPLGGE